MPIDACWVNSSYLYLPLSEVRICPEALSHNLYWRSCAPNPHASPQTHNALRTMLFIDTRLHLAANANTNYVTYNECCGSSLCKSNRPTGFRNLIFLDILGDSSHIQTLDCVSKNSSILRQLDDVVMTWGCPNSKTWISPFIVTMITQLGRYCFILQATTPYLGAF